MPYQSRFGGCAQLPPDQDLVHAKTIRKPGSDGPLRSEAMDEHLSGLMLLGTPDLIQNDTLEAQAERMTLGSDGVQIDEAAAKRKWMLLMQVDSKEAVYGHMWGDSGCLYFMIPRSDLKAGVFTNVRCILQCY